MAAESSSPLRKWMKKQDIFDKDLETMMSSMGIANPEEDFKAFTEKQWDELYRRGCVERAKELKDQAAKVRLEKKMVKLEKFWRAESGIKKTSLKADSKAAQDEKAPEDQSSAAKQNDVLEKAAELKKFLMKNDCYNVDLLMVLSDHGVNKEEDLVNIQTNMEWGRCEREFRVSQRGKLKDQKAKSRADKTLKKVEKIWRQKTGIKNTSIQESSKNKKQKDAPKDQKVKELETSGKALKSWMKKQGIWNMALYEELVAMGVTDEDGFKNIKEKEFDELVRKVRVDRFKEIKEAKARQNADKVLVKFEKTWRKASGIKKTSLK